RIQERMVRERGVLSITATNHPPGGSTVPPAHQFSFGNELAELDHVGVEPAYFETLDMELREGTAFAPSHQADTSRHYAVLNERAVQALGIENAVGSVIRGCGLEFAVIGVISNSKTYGFDRAVNPTIYSV